MAVSEIRIGKDLGATTSVTYSLGSGCDASTVLTPTFDSNCSGWLTGTGGTGKNGTVNLTTTQANTGGERSGYLIPSIKGKQCTDYKIKVTQEAGGSGGDCPEPSTKGSFIVSIGGCQCSNNESACGAGRDVLELACTGASDCQGEGSFPGYGGRTSTLKVTERVHFKIEIAGGGASVLYPDQGTPPSYTGVTSGYLEANTDYQLFYPYVPYGTEKTAVITFCNDNGTRIINYKIACTHT